MYLCSKHSNYEGLNTKYYTKNQCFRTIMEKKNKFKPGEEVQVWQVRLGEADVWKPGKVKTIVSCDKLVLIKVNYDTPDKEGNLSVTVPYHLVEKLN